MAQDSSISLLDIERLIDRHAGLPARGGVVADQIVGVDDQPDARRHRLTQEIELQP
jgi:hypothetical protein